jgi:protein TonB
MFDDLVECSPTPKKTSKRWTVIVSAVIQCVVLAVLVLIPLIYTDTLEGRMLSTLLVAPAPPPPPPPPAAPVQKVIVKPVARLIQAGKLMAPKAIPKDVKIIKEEEMPPDVVGVTGGVPGGVPGGQAGGVIGGIIGGVVGAPPPPKAPQRIRQGGNVQAALIMNRVQPQYPPLARQARVSGTVKLHAIIAKDGTVQELQVISGHPLLIQAALDAVRQWRYRPTLLNTEPVEVDTTIDVIFTLN